MKGFTRKYTLDIAERVIVTFLGGVVAAWIVAPFDPTNWRGYALGLVAAGISAVKSLAATLIGNKESASLTQ